MSEWSRWPWQRCPATTIDVYGPCRCDLKRHHSGPHRTELGMYDADLADAARKHRDGCFDFQCPLCAALARLDGEEET